MLLRLLPANLNLLTLLQDDRPVLRLILDIGVLVEIPNSAPCRGRHLLEVRERASELWPGVRMKFAHNFRSARENLFCTLQNTNFRPLRIDFYAPRSRQPVVDRIDFARHRVRPSLALGASLCAVVFKNDKLSMKLQADAQNLNNRLNVINFGGLFSGNAIAPPRSYALRLQTTF